jgi:hypothetical protein
MPPTQTSNRWRGRKIRIVLMLQMRMYVGEERVFSLAGTPSINSTPYRIGLALVAEYLRAI